MTEKTCPHCKEKKEIHYYNKICKACAKASVIRNLENEYAEILPVNEYIDELKKRSGE